MSVPMEEPSRTSKALGPRPATALRRAEIVRAAADVFAEKGFAHGTLHEIADRVGMTHAGVLHHFGSKEQLLVEALAYRDRLMLEHRPEGQDLFHYLVDIAVANSKQAGMIQAFLAAAGDSVAPGRPAQPYFVERYRILRAEVATAFEQTCTERGVSDPAVIAAASTGILAVLDGVQVQWLLSPEAVDLEASTTFVIDAIVAAVLA
ncbi:TetR/AcrR family transcriptional regulator [Tessaracoccus defluvii]|nr:TetR/AcrR family transcriptional regulator [Tessaracoccus defluvii]